MAKKKDDFHYDIEEFIAPLKESDKHDWVKGVARISWNDSPSTLDIRQINMSTKIAGRGVSLSDEEADQLTHILLDEGYGNLSDIIEVMKKRQSVYDYMSIEEASEEEGYHIHFEGL